MAHAPNPTNPSSTKTPRRTNSRTFRLYRDQIDFIESINGDCASVFMRFLLDAWMDNKIPDAVKKEFYEIRRDLRKRADLEHTKKLLLTKAEDEDEV